MKNWALQFGLLTIMAFKPKNDKMMTDNDTTLKSVLDAKKANFEANAPEEKQTMYTGGLLMLKKVGLYIMQKMSGIQHPISP